MSEANWRFPVIGKEDLNKIFGALIGIIGFISTSFWVPLIIIVIAILWTIDPSKFEFLGDAEKWKTFVGKIHFIWETVEGFIESKLGQEKTKKIDNFIDKIVMFFNSKDVIDNLFRATKIKRYL